MRRHAVTVTDEDKYLADIKPQPFVEWSAGKKFYVTDNKISLIFVPEKSGREQLAGQILTYIGTEAVTDIKGEQICELNFTSPSGASYVYRIERPMAKLFSDNSTDIPFTIELSLVEAARQRLKGNTYYTVTSAWLDTTATPYTGRKFVPVTITDVMAGNDIHPIALMMTDEKGNPFMFYLSVGDKSNETRSFARLFSLTDPHLRYPAITDEIWQLIIAGRVATDMTREECRLALGAPDNVDRTPGYNILREIWTYSNGKYLIFEDGLLRNFRQ